MLLHLKSRVNLGKVRKLSVTTVFGKTTFIDNTLPVIMYTLHVYFSVLPTKVEEGFMSLYSVDLIEKIKFMMSSLRSLRHLHIKIC